MLDKTNKNTLNLKRSELVAATSLELLKQKKTTDSRRVLGRNFAKQSKPNFIVESLRNPASYIIVVKFVNAGQHWGDFSAALSKDNSRFQNVFAVTQIRNLYPILVADSNLRWLTTILASSSVYLLVAQDREHYLKLIRSCIRFESNAGGSFFEILFLKEQAKFIDFRRATSKQAAAELRELYSTRTINDILFELSSCVLSVPVTFNTIFSISLTMGLPSALYRITNEISN